MKTKQNKQPQKQIQPLAQTLTSACAVKYIIY